MIFNVLAFLFFCSSVHSLLLQNPGSVFQESIRRLKRQSLPGRFSFGGNRGANIGALGQFLPDPNIGRSTGGHVDLARPSGSFEKSTNVFGLYNRKQGIQNAGLRGNNNIGATWGDQTSVLGGLIGGGKKNDVNFNANRGSLSVQKQKGIPGLASETTNTNVDPLGLQFGRQQRKCFGGIILGGDGICSTNNKGIGAH